MKPGTDNYVILIVHLGLNVSSSAHNNCGCMAWLMVVILWQHNFIYLFIYTYY